jgi:hypothetical protein
MMTRKRMRWLPIWLAVPLVVSACDMSPEGGGHPNVAMGKAEVTEALILLDAVKGPVQMFYRSNNRWPTDEDLAGMAPGVRAGNGTELMVDVSGRIAKGTLILEYDPGSSRWTCYAEGIENEMLPANCRD